MKILLFVLVLLFFAPPVSAELKINEFSSGGSGSNDWVEIFNAGAESATMSGYRLRDTTESNKLDLSGSISPGGFVSFPFSDHLNGGSEDTVKLFKVENTVETLIDQIPYGGNNICYPSETQTIGRLPDGGVNIVRFSVATKASTNNASIEACPAPTNTPTPGPTNTPSPTNTPVPSATPVPSSTPKPSATPKVTPTPVVELLPSMGEQEMVNASMNGAGTQLLNLDDEEPPPSEPSVLGETTQKKNTILPVLFIILGVVGLTVSLFLLYRHSRQADILTE